MTQTRLSTHPASLPPARPLRVRFVVLASICLTLIVVALAAYRAWVVHASVLSEAYDDAGRLSAIMVDQAEISLNTVDFTLQRAVDRHRLNQLFGQNLSADLSNHFNMWVAKNPQLVALFMSDASGRVLLAAHDAAYEGWMRYDEGIRKHPLFARLSSDEGEEVGVELYRAKSTQTDSTQTDSAETERGRDLLLVGRRWYNLDGSVGGVVFGVVRLDYFMEFFASLNVGRYSRFSMLDAQGRLLMHGVDHPLYSNGLTQALVPRILRQVQAYGEVDNEQKNAHFASAALAPAMFSSDVGQERFIVAPRQLPTSGLIAVVALDSRDYLASFHAARMQDALFLLIFIIFGGLVTYFVVMLARNTRKAQESEGAAILASQAKTEFLANMSHELRTPLNAIIGFSEMMSAGYFGPLNPKQKERMQDINLCGNHLLQLISDILEFSKGEAGKLEIVEERVDVCAIIEEVVRMMGDRYKAKDIHIQMEVEENLPFLFADKRKLKQILLNLLSNAIKFTPVEGRITLHARLEMNGSMRISVADSGIGIAPADIPTALSVFGQVHRSKSHEGTGLGLPLCRMFVDLHGGKLHIDSAVGKGTTVRIMMPAARVMHDAM